MVENYPDLKSNENFLALQNEPDAIRDLSRFEIDADRLLGHRGVFHVDPDERLRLGGGPLRSAGRAAAASRRA